MNECTCIVDRFAFCYQHPGGWLIRGGILAPPEQDKHQHDDCYNDQNGPQHGAPSQ